MRFRVGDRVKVRDYWTSGTQNMEGLMDKYLGQFATVVFAEPRYYQLDIDNGEWFWDEQDLLAVATALYFLPPMQGMHSLHTGKEWVLRYGKKICDLVKEGTFANPFPYERIELWSKYEIIDCLIDYLPDDVKWPNINEGVFQFTFV